MSDVLVIGIAGGSGSGKTSLANKIAARFRGSLALLRHDDYYLPHDDLTAEERAKLNYDCPEAFDTPLLIRHLHALRAGDAVDAPVYDYTVHTRTPDTRHVDPAPVVLVEGILIFDNPTLRSLFDIRIFVDTDADVRIIRRILRDVRRRGRTLESVTEQYLTTVKPMHETYVEPTRKYAHLIIPEGARNPAAYEMIVGRIEKHLYRRPAQNRPRRPAPPRR